VTLKPSISRRKVLQYREPVAGLVGLVDFDNTLENTPAAIPEIGLQGVLVIAGEATDDLPRCTARSKAAR